MANIIKLSKRQPDILLEEGEGKKPDTLRFEKTASAVSKLVVDAPKSLTTAAAHPLQVKENQRAPTLADFVEMRRSLGGNAQAEKLIEELNAASQFNRGPEGFSASSRLHFDMLLNCDEKIGYGDYLSYHERS
uniref:Uncharacterized protein n=1 Tax=Ditylenchus dipsaci TaxID=166011 RepID=A0A915E9I5_9BILA